MNILLYASNPAAQDEPNLSLTYLAAYVRAYVPDVNFKILFQLQWDASEIQKFAPDLIGITSLSPHINHVKQWVSKFKEILNVPIIMGGHHISNLPSHLPNGCEVGIIGEGEETFKELVLHLRDNGLRFDLSKLSQVKGIVYRDAQGKFIITEKRPQIVNLDTVPFPARDLIDMEYYLKDHNIFGDRMGRGTFMFTSRGCPYRCQYCASTAFWGKLVRYNSPEYVINEIKHLIENYDVKLIRIYDDLFAFDKRRLKSIVDLIVKERINEKVEFGVYSRTNVFDDELCELLKKMNVTHVDFGFESGSQRILKYLKYGSTTPELGIKAVGLCRKHGFKVGGTFIIGSPDETEEEIMETFEFVKKLDLDKFGAYILVPFPGTPLWHWAIQNGKVSEDMDFSKLTMNKRGGLTKDDLDNVIIVNDKLKRERIIELYNMFEEERAKKFAYRWDIKHRNSEM
ncbi:B12-binding domain-containing radical SAM protein [Candidatus Woesearchaeota archaeon]|nr:B12-binding domain-containing radical SAM protein [Candidatus Woesearchaeota archaeon]